MNKEKKEINLGVLLLLDIAIVLLLIYKEPLLDFLTCWIENLYQKALALGK